MENTSAAWASFYFALLNRHSWLYRKMEHQKYAGKNLWAKSVSLDINFEQIKEYYRLFVLGQPENEPQNLSKKEIDQRDQFLSELPLPISCVEKSLLFSDFSLRDKNGGALSLAIGDVCAYFSVTALCGAVIEEAKSETAKFELKAHENESPLYQNVCLLQFLQNNWIGNRFLPDPDSNDFESDDDEMEAIHKLAIRLLEQKTEHPEERQLLDFYFATSVSFRFFMRLFYRHSILWATIDANDKLNTLIKINAVASTDIFQRNVKNKPGKVDIRVPYDGIPYSENYHLEITAPNGTGFYPLQAKHGTTVTPFALHRSSFNYAMSTIGESKKAEKTDSSSKDSNRLSENGKGVFLDAIQPKGSFSGRNINAWSTPLFTDSNDEEPIRRIPSSRDSSERKYELRFTLVPLLGKKSIAYQLVFIISALYWLLFTAYAAASNDAGGGMLNIVLLIWGFVMPAIAVYISLTGNEPHIPRRLYRWPRRLCWVCLTFDYFTATIILLSLALSNAESACVILDIPVHWITLAVGVCVPVVLYIAFRVWARSINVDHMIKTSIFEKLHNVDIVTD